MENEEKKSVAKKINRIELRRYHLHGTLAIMTGLSINSIKSKNAAIVGKLCWEFKNPHHFQTKFLLSSSGGCILIKEFSDILLVRGLSLLDDSVVSSDISGRFVRQVKNEHKNTLALAQTELQRHFTVISRAKKVNYELLRIN